MTIPTKPGERCRVVGSRSAFNGEGNGPNMGKIVVTIYMHNERAGLEQENVWHCMSTNGEVLQTYYGAGFEADFLECWLEVIPPDQTLPKELATEQELTS